MKGWLDKYVPKAQNGIEGTMGGLTDKGFNYSPAWGGQFAMGGNIPGSVGFTYARTAGAAPSEGPYAKKTMPSAQNGAKVPVIEDEGSFNKDGVWIPDWEKMTAQAKKLGAKKVRTKNGSVIYFNDKWEVSSVDDNPDAKAQNGQEMKYYQAGLDFQPKTISQKGSIIPADNRARGDMQSYYPQIARMKDTPNREDIHSADDIVKKPNEKGYISITAYPSYVQKKLDEQGYIDKAEPKRSAASKAWTIATHPMTAIENKVRLGRIPEHFERGEANNLDIASSIINPFVFTDAASAIPGNLKRGEFLQAGLNTLLAAPIIPAAKAIKKIPFTKVGKDLAKIEREGLSQGLSAHDIAKRQLQEVGITSNQREAYVPGLSDFAEKYIYPYSYGGWGNQSKLRQTWDLIRKGGYDVSSIDPKRQDAWRLYLGKPQQNNTFRMAETAPINHPSYSPKQLSKMDIYSINKNEVVNDFQLSSIYDPDIPEIKKAFNRLDNELVINHGDDVMGGYNTRFNKHGLEYNDIWDLNAPVSSNLLPESFKNTRLFDKLFIKNKQIPVGDETITVEVPRTINLPVSKIFGKPFMSHEVLPYTPSNFLSEVRGAISNKLERLDTMAERLNSPDVNRVLSPGLRRNLEKELLQKPILEEYAKKIKNYPIRKQGGVIKDDRGQWAHPGEITQIDSNDITMQGVPYPVLGIGADGEQMMMQPGKDYRFNKGPVTEIPMAKGGMSVNNADAQPLKKLDQLLNFTNYNKPTKGGWLDKYN